MKNILYPYIVALGFLLSFTAEGIEGEENYDFSIVNVGLIDGTGKPLQENVSIYVRDGQIVTISNKPQEELKSETTIDGTGKYLIPGLIESHAHPSESDIESITANGQSNTLKTMVHYGVTSAVLLGSSNAGYSLMKKLQEFSNDGSIIAPHIYYSSPLLTIEGGHPVKMYPSDNWKDGQTIYYIKEATPIEPIITEAKTNNAIGIKLVVEDGPMPPFGERMADELVQKVVKEAHKAEVPVYVHVSDMEEVKICVEAGADNFAHFTWEGIDWDKDRETIATMSNNNSSWITTLMLIKSLIYYRMHPEWLERPEVAGVYEKDLIEGLPYPNMAEEGKSILKGMAGSDTISMINLVTPIVQDILKVQKMGVNVVLGSDVGGDRFILPGLSLHEEMELMQMGGMEPVDIIKMATHNSAKMLKIDDKTGTLEEGKFADFILLKENPLIDISNTLAIEKVYKAGIEQPRIGTR